MNAKEQIIRLLKREIAYFKASDLDTTELYNLIATTEAAIFELPSQEEIEQKLGFSSRESDIFLAGINFILNYKKTEPDGK
jgi:predicted transposase YdaD